MATRELYEFGDFALDLTGRRLAKAGAPLRLTPKAFDLLAALVRRAGELVTKRELLDLVWPDVSVEEGILAVHVSALRKALDDGGADPVFIETVPRTGYRFSHTVKRLHRGTAPISMQWPIGVLPAQPAVSELIGRGRSYLLTASIADVPRAVEAFQSAVALDPEYAAGHAGLALACCAQAELRVRAPHAAYTDAKTAALRALAMDDGNADAQVALGTVLFLSDWNWGGARRSFERALQIDPDHAEGLLQYGRLLEALGHLEEGLAAKRKALERNPSSSAVHLQIALSFWNQRRYDGMIEWAERSLALDPRHLLARECIAAAYLMKGDVDRHMAELLAHADAAGAPPAMLDELRAVYAAEGRAGVVRYALRVNPNAPPVQFAVLFGELGDLDNAFRHLDSALDRRDPALVHLAVAPQWDCLRVDSRLDERLTRIGLGPAKHSAGGGEKLTQ